ncbi:hypothetical protein ACFWWM_12420 [Streptomyces sp. NPDC058682]
MTARLWLARGDAAPASASATGTAEQLLLFGWGHLTLSDLKPVRTASGRP